jgi:hypothetical protein
MVCGDFLVRLACASNQTALELVEDHGVVETFHTLLRRHDAESRTCGAIGLKKFAKFSERAAREIVWRGALDDIRAMLPTCDRYRTPPSTPLAMEKDNILAEAFGVGASDEARAKKVDLEALLSSRKSPKKSPGDEDSCGVRRAGCSEHGRSPARPAAVRPQGDDPRVCRAGHGAARGAPVPFIRGGSVHRPRRRRPSQAGFTSERETSADVDDDDRASVRARVHVHAASAAAAAAGHGSKVGRGRQPGAGG